MERTTRRIFWWLRFVEGRPVAAAPWQGRCGLLLFSSQRTEKRKKKRTREEEDDGGAREGERLGFDAAP
jgi:hypothetical protein